MDASGYAWYSATQLRHVFRLALCSTSGALQGGTVFFSYTALRMLFLAVDAACAAGFAELELLDSIGAVIPTTQRKMSSLYSDANFPSWGLVDRWEVLCSCLKRLALLAICRARATTRCTAQQQHKRPKRMHNSSLAVRKGVMRQEQLSFAHRQGCCAELLHQKPQQTFASPC